MTFSVQSVRKRRSARELEVSNTSLEKQAFRPANLLTIERGMGIRYGSHCGSHLRPSLVLDTLRMRSQHRNKYYIPNHKSSGSFQSRVLVYLLLPQQLHLSLLASSSAYSHNFGPARQNGMLGSHQRA